MTTNSDIDGIPVMPDDADSPKKRARIVKRDTDRVYSANSEQGERYDSVSDERTHKRATISKAKDDKVAAIHALESQAILPPKKNRGRPSKAYLDAQRAYEEAVLRQQEQIAEARAALAGTIAVVSGPTDADTAVPDTHDVHDDDDIPEFVRMQQQSQAPADAPSPSECEQDEVRPSQQAVERGESAPETDAVIPAAPNTAQSVSPEEPAIDPLLDRLSRAHAAGQTFIIDIDVPTITSDGYLSLSDAGTSILDTAKTLVGHSPAASSAQPVSTPDARRQESPAAESPQRAANATLTYNRDIIVPLVGVLDIDPQGVGYLRSADYSYMPSPDDVFVPQQLIRTSGLRHGDTVECNARAPKEGEKYYTLTEIITVNGRLPHEVRDRISFEHLTPLFPDEQYRLSAPGTKAPLSCRIIDLFAPIGKGQRALIVAQPKTGKTVLMKQVANAIAAAYPDTYLIMLLIDERPEEVTDMARTVQAEVIASTFDEPAKRHVRIANLVLEKTKRMVECGRDVVVFLDSITRLARAFNTEAPASGKILTGGVDANALQRPKRFFGAARNIEGGGSLTIIATALIETGSKMDEVIFEEFKGTGNMELLLDRNLANKRIFPAVNLLQSSTRREDLLLDENTINRMYVTRNYMADMSPVESMSFLRKHLDNTISNEEFIATIDK